MMIKSKNSKCFIKPNIQVLNINMQLGEYYARGILQKSRLCY